MAKILVMEDSVDVREMITTVLKIYGHDVEGTGKPAQLNSIISYFNPELILLDGRLSKQSGREICKEIKTCHKTLPVMMMSTEPRLLADPKSCGADDFIEKPFNIRDLKNRIEYLLKRARINNTTALLQS